MTYKTPIVLNEQFKGIPFKDYIGNEYNVLVEGDNLSTGVFINVKDFGAKCDGITDDTMPLKNALQSANETDIVYIPNSILITDTINNSKAVSLICQGEIIYDGTPDKTAIIIGSEDYVPFYRNFKLNVTNKKINVANANLKGLVIYNLYNSELTIGVNGFNTGINIVGNSHGCVFNKIFLLNIVNNVNGLVIESLNGGWVNDNIFNSGDFSIWGSHLSLIDYPVSLILTNNGGTFTNNNNIFNNCAFEQTKGTCIYVRGARLNKFIQMRFDTTNIDKFYDIGKLDYQNIFDVGYLRIGEYNKNTSNSMNVFTSIIDTNLVSSKKDVFQWQYNKNDIVLIESGVSTNHCNFKTDKIDVFNVSGSNLIFNDDVLINKINILNVLKNNGISTGVGVWIDTTVCKDFTILSKLELLTGSSNWIIQPFDENNNLRELNINGERTIIGTSYNQGGWQSYGYVGGGNIDNFQFNVDTEIKKIFVGFLMNGNALIKEFKILGDERFYYTCNPQLSNKLLLDYSKPLFSLADKGVEFINNNLQELNNDKGNYIISRIKNKLVSNLSAPNQVYNIKSYF